jgi:hypothetical protein
MPGRIFLIIAALCGLSSVPAQAEIEITIDRLAHIATARSNDWDVMIAPNRPRGCC